jgi:hypothetical protein
VAVPNWKLILHLTSDEGKLDGHVGDPSGQDELRYVRSEEEIRTINAAMGAK